MTKRASIISLIIILISLAFLALKPQLDMLKTGYNAYLESATDTFVAYGEYLAQLNPKLDLVLAGDVEKAKEIFLDEEKVVNDYYRDAYQTARLINGNGFSRFQWLYTDINKIMVEILSDNKISDSEHHYIESLKAYTAEITAIHQKVLGDVKTDGYVDYYKTKALSKHIPKRFNEFSEAADQILNKDAYAFLQTYQGDFSDVPFEPIQALVTKLFEKLETGKTLVSDNRAEINNNTYRFDTDVKSGDIMKDLSKPSDQVSYSVFYQKRTKMIDISAVSYSTGSAEKLLSEADGLARANALAKRIEPSAVLASKKTLHNVDRKKFEGYRFVYQLENKGINQEQQQLTIEIGKTGIITKVRLWDSGVLNF